MRKEVLFAILLGILLGGAVAFGIWRANLSLGPSKENIASSPTPTPQEAATSQLVITQPEDGTVTSKDKITIKGATTPLSIVVITADGDDEILRAEADGGFEQEISLTAGPNLITVKSFDEQGNQSEQRLVVVYSTEFPGEGKE